jgi:hypothetical protein
VRRRGKAESRIQNPEYRIQNPEGEKGAHAKGAKTQRDLETEKKLKQEESNIV